SDRPRGCARGGDRRRRGGVSRNAAPSGLRGDRAHRAGRPPARRPTRRVGGASAGTGPDLVPGHRADDRLVHPDRPPGGPPHLAAELHRRPLPHRRIDPVRLCGLAAGSRPLAPGPTRPVGDARAQRRVQPGGLPPGAGRARHQPRRVHRRAARNQRDHRGLGRLAPSRRPAGTAAPDQLGHRGRGSRDARRVPVDHDGPTAAPVRRTFRTGQEIKTLLAVAAGREPADLYVEGADLLNVYSGEVYPANVAVTGGRIACAGRGRAMVGPETRVLQCPGKILVPGYVEPHTHITGMSTPEEFAREVLRSGTTTLVADTLQILLHTPPARVPQLLTTLSDLPVLILWSLRLHGASHLPEEPMVSRERIEALLAVEAVRAVGEVTRWPAVYHGDDDLLQKIALALAAGRRVEGHAPGVSYERLVALAAAGWSSDHEAIAADEIVRRLRAGVYTMLRHSSLRPDLPLLAPAITDERRASGRLMLTADGPEAVTIVERGYLSHVIRAAIESGITPVAAYQMATINP